LAVALGLLPAQVLLAVEAPLLLTTALGTGLALVAGAFRKDGAGGAP